MDEILLLLRIKFYMFLETGFNDIFVIKLFDKATFFKLWHSLKIEETSVNRLSLNLIYLIFNFY